MWNGHSNHGMDRMEGSDSQWEQREVVFGAGSVRSIAVRVSSVVYSSTTIRDHISCLAPNQTTAQATINYGKAYTTNSHPEIQAKPLRCQTMVGDLFRRGACTVNRLSRHK